MQHVTHFTQEMTFSVTCEMEQEFIRNVHVVASVMFGGTRGTGSLNESMLQYNNSAFSFV